MKSVMLSINVESTNSEVQKSTAGRKSEILIINDHDIEVVRV
jgi:hypothetical protein